MSFLERKKTNYPRSSFLTDFDIIILQILKMEGLFDFERSKERSICVQMLLHWKEKKQKKSVFLKYELLRPLFLIFSMRKNTSNTE